MSSTSTKQVFVIRKDLKMRKGKTGAQIGHATQKLLLQGNMSDDPSVFVIPVSELTKVWLSEGHARIVVWVNSEEELLAIYEETLEAGLPAALVTDRGHTEFHGVPTHTCVGIGPASIEDVDVITGHLPLL